MKIIYLSFITLKFTLSQHTCTLMAERDEQTITKIYQLNVLVNLYLDHRLIGKDQYL